MSTLAPGIAGYVLTTNGTGANPSWTQAASVGINYWDLVEGALYPKNSTVDLLIGGTASDSADFAFVNLDSGTPTASFAGQITLNKNTTNYINSLNDQSLSFRTSIGGDTGLADRLYIASTGNIGIGTTNPTELLDVAGNATLSGTLGLGPLNTTQAGTCCLLYTSDAADDLLCVDLGGRRRLKKKNTTEIPLKP